MAGVRTAGTVIAGTLLFAATPLAASDFSFFGYYLIGAYYLFAVPIAFLILAIRAGSRRRIGTDLIAAILVALLLAPSLSGHMTRWVALALAAPAGLDDPPLTALSLIAATVALLSIFRLTPRRRPAE